MFDNVSSDSKDVYITIGNWTSTFSLYTYFVDSSNINMYEGFPIIGEVEEGEIETYKLIFSFKYLIL